MTMHLRELGAGPTVVLLHAFPCDGRMWLPQARAVAEAGHRVLVADLPGFGSSPLIDSEPSLEAVAERLIAELGIRGIDRYVLGGVSLGGYVAMALLRMAPEQVAALILCDTKATADGETARVNRERLAASVDAAPAGTARILEQSVLPGLLGEKTFRERPAVVELVRGWLRDAPPASVSWYQRAMAGRPDSTAALTAAALPMLVLRGEQDALSSAEEARIMCATSAESQIVQVPDAGHLANVEAPEAVTEAVCGFLRLVTGPQSS